MGRAAVNSWSLHSADAAVIFGKHYSTESLSNIGYIVQRNPSLHLLATPLHASSCLLINTVGVRNSDLKAEAVWVVYLQLVIEAQLDIRHSTQEDFHDNLAIHITPQHGALVAHQHVDLHQPY